LKTIIFAPSVLEQIRALEEAERRQVGRAIQWVPEVFGQESVLHSELTALISV
jgi:hypothetical protein